MKTTNKLFQWCKTTLMMLPLAAMLIFSGCTKDDGNDDLPSYNIIDFENVDARYLAGPSAYGENL